MPFALAKLADVKASLGFSGEDYDGLLGTLLLAATATAERIAGRPLRREVGRVEILRPLYRHTRYLRLDLTPVESVESVQRRDVDQYDIDWADIASEIEGQDYRLSRRGELEALAVVDWSAYSPEVRVVYTAGYQDPEAEPVAGAADAPEDLAHAIAVETVRLWNRRRDAGLDAVATGKGAATQLSPSEVCRELHDAAWALRRITLILMATAVISIGLTSASAAVIERFADARQRVATAIDEGVTQVLIEAESFVKDRAFAGGASPGGGQVGIRSGALRRDITHERTGPGRGLVGTTENTSSYARAILGPDATTIRPVRANKLWIPIADNLSANGETRITPSGLFDSFERSRIKIFTSDAGNQVVFLENERTPGQPADDGGRTPGRLLFVLKDQVVIQGTDALARTVESFGSDRGREILEGKIREALA